MKSSYDKLWEQYDRLDQVVTRCDKQLGALADLCLCHNPNEAVVKDGFFEGLYNVLESIRRDLNRV